MLKLRRCRRVILWLCMLLCFAGLPVLSMKASVTNELVMTSVSDIAHIKGNVAYQTVSLESSTRCAGYKFTVPKDAMVKIVTNVSDLCANYSDSEGNYFSHNLKVATRVYRNAAYVDQVGTEVTAFRNQNSNTGSLFLTAGEYYVQFEATDPIETGKVLTCLLSGSVKVAGFYQPFLDTQGTVSSLNLTKVPDMAEGENVQSYQPITLSNITKSAMAKITLKKPGTVKFITNASNVTQTVSKNGETQTVSPKIVTRVFQNAACTEQLGKDVEAVRNKNSETSVMYLEKGSYYIQYDAPDVASDAAINGTLKVAVLYQPYQTNETVAVSSKNKQNTLAWSKVQHGFLSQLSNTDYYKFKVDSYNPVKLWCRTSESGKTSIVLYNGNYEKIAKASGSGSMEEVGFEKYVKPGTYYVEISSTARGAYDIKLTKQKYHLALSYKMPFVSVKTVTDYQEIRYLKGNYYDTDLNSKVWNKGIVLRKGKKTFAVNESGYYTVRVTDASGKRFIKTIYIAKADKSKPVKPTFTSCKAGQYVIRGKAEKNSIVYVKVNAYETVHKVRVSKDGTFRVTLDYYLFKGDRVKAYAVDQAGNKGAVRTIKVQ